MKTRSQWCQVLPAALLFLAVGEFVPVHAAPGWRIDANPGVSGIQDCWRISPTGALNVNCQGSPITADWAVTVQLEGFPAERLGRYAQFVLKFDPQRLIPRGACGLGRFGANANVCQPGTAGLAADELMVFVAAAEFCPASAFPATVPVATVYFSVNTAGGLFGAASLSIDSSRSCNAIGSCSEPATCVWTNDPVNCFPFDALDTDASPSAAQLITDPSVTGACVNPPVILAPPQSQTVCLGSPATFSIMATGAPPLSYQWRYAGPFGGSFLPSATGSVFTIPSVSVTNGGSYFVEVLNAGGSVISPFAFLTSALPPIITVQPRSMGARLGATVTMSVTLTNTTQYSTAPPPSYQWCFNDTALAGAVQSNLTVMNVGFADAGNYTVKISNSCGSATSQPALLEVGTPPAFVTHPQSQTVAVGAEVNFSVATTGSLPIGYRLRRGSMTLSNQMLHAHEATFTLGNVQTSNSGTYTIVITNLFSPPASGLSSQAVLNVLVPPGITVQPWSQNLTSGASATLTVGVTGTAASVSWFFGDTGLAGQTNTTLVLSNLSVADAGCYFAVVSNALGSVTSEAAVIRLSPRPQITDFFPKTGAPDTLITIVGEGFENGRPDDHCLVLAAAGLRLAYVRALEVSSTQMLVRVGPIPPAYRGVPLVLKLATGKGERFEDALCPDEAAEVSALAGTDNWRFTGDSTNFTMAAATFTWTNDSPVGLRAAATEPPPQFIDSGPPRDGALSIRFEQDWGGSARYTVYLSITSRATGERDLILANVAFIGRGSRVDCAQALGNLLRRTLQGQRRFTGLNCSVTNDGPAAVLTLSLLGAAIEDGRLQLTGEPPPLVTGDLVALSVTNLWRREVRRRDLPRSLRQISWEVATNPPCPLWFDRRAVKLTFSREALNSFACTNQSLLPNPAGPGWWRVQRVFRLADVGRFVVRQRVMSLEQLNELQPRLAPDVSRMLMSIDHVEVVLPMEPADPNTNTLGNEAVVITDPNGVTHLLGEPGFTVLSDTAANPAGFQLITTALSTDLLPLPGQRTNQPPARPAPGEALLCPGVLWRPLTGTNGDALSQPEEDCPDGRRDPNVLGGQLHQGLIDPVTGADGAELGVDYANSSLQLHTWLLTPTGDVLGAPPGGRVVGPAGDFNGDGLGDAPIGAPAPLDPTVRDWMPGGAGLQEQLRSQMQPVRFALVEAAPPTAAELAAVNAMLAAQIPGVQPLPAPPALRLCVRGWRLKNLWGVERRAVFDTTLHHWSWRLTNQVVFQKPAHQVQHNRQALAAYSSAHTEFRVGQAAQTRQLGRADVRFFRLGYRVLLPRGLDLMIRFDELHLVVPEVAGDPQSSLLLLSTERDENRLRAAYAPGVLAGTLPDPLATTVPGARLVNLDPTNTWDIGLGGANVFEADAVRGQPGFAVTQPLRGNVDLPNLLLNHQLKLYCWRLDSAGNLRSDSFPFNAGTTLNLALPPTPALPEFADALRRPIGDPTQLTVTLRGASDRLDFTLRQNPPALEFSWGGVGTLQQATQVIGPWLDISDCTVSPFLAPLTNAQEFFRLRR